MTPSRFADLTIAEFLARVSSSEPVPGGGSVSAIAGSFAAGLVAMVASLSLDRPKYASYEATNRRAASFGSEAASRLLALADQDADAYAGFAAALKLPRDTDADRQARERAMREAARKAAEAPLAILDVCSGVAVEVEAISGRSNVNASSDVNVAALLIDAAARGAAANVMVNLPSVGDEGFAARATGEVMQHLRSIADLTATAREHAVSGRLRDPEAA